MSDRIQPITITRAGLIGSLVVIAIAGLCVRLGFWQISRLQQRDARNQLITERMELPVIGLEPAFGDTAGLLYRRVIVNGRFDHEHTIVLAGRSLRGTPGVYILTPALLGGGRTGVLVNRGWYPAGDGFSVQLDSLVEPVMAKLTGFVLPFPGSARPPREDSALPDSAFRRAWFSPDAVAIRRQFGYPLLDLQVQALPEAEVSKFPIRLPPPTLDRGPHLGYAIQWFSFALIAIGGWVTLMLKKGELRRGTPEPEMETGGF
ncbi:MAG: SURF1 family protein [Gemmatimonadota bacterium]